MRIINILHYVTELLRLGDETFFESEEFYVLHHEADLVVIIIWISVGIIITPRSSFFIFVVSRLAFSILHGLLATLDMQILLAAELLIFRISLSYILLQLFLHLC